MTTSIDRTAVHDILFKKGMTLKQWTAEQGMDYQFTCVVITGRLQGTRGKSRDYLLRLQNLVAEST